MSVIHLESWQITDIRKKIISAIDSKISTPEKIKKIQDLINPANTDDKYEPAQLLEILTEYDDCLMRSITSDESELYNVMLDAIGGVKELLIVKKSSYIDKMFAQLSLRESFFRFFEDLQPSLDYASSGGSAASSPRFIDGFSRSSSYSTNLASNSAASSPKFMGAFSASNSASLSPALGAQDFYSDFFQGEQYTIPKVDDYSCFKKMIHVEDNDYIKNEPKDSIVLEHLRKTSPEVFFMTGQKEIDDVSDYDENSEDRRQSGAGNDEDSEVSPSRALTFSFNGYNSGADHDMEYGSDDGYECEQRNSSPFKMSFE